jgi:hypothetical protein
VATFVGVYLFNTFIIMIYAFKDDSTVLEVLREDKHRISFITTQSHSHSDDSCTYMTLDEKDLFDLIGALHLLRKQLLIDNK